MRRVSAGFPGSGRRHQGIARLWQFNGDFHIVSFAKWPEAVLQVDRGARSGWTLPYPEKQKPRQVSSPGFLIGTTGSGGQDCRIPELSCAGLCMFQITDSRPWHSRSFPVKMGE
jgi:hypothetical protein